MKKFIWKFLNFIGIGPWVQLAVKSELKENGWHRSFITKQSVDRNGKPLPWLTYPFLDFIQPRLKKSFLVFEYGCGNSTLWFAQHVQHIDSVEHEKNWYEQIQSQLPPNVNLFHKELQSSDYEKCILHTPHFYDIVIVDGRKREACTKTAIPKLKSDGIIVLDNAERYPEITDFLISNGFQKIEFWGMPPIVPLKTCTTIFYKKPNILEI